MRYLTFTLALLFAVTLSARETVTARELLDKINNDENISLSGVTITGDLR